MVQYALEVKAVGKDMQGLPEKQNENRSHAWVMKVEATPGSSKQKAVNRHHKGRRELLAVCRRHHKVRRQLGGGESGD